MEKITPLQSDNVKYVAQIDHECFTTESWSEAQFVAEIGDDSKYYAVFSISDTVVGFGSYAQILDEGHILNIAVKPEYQNRGIGRKILSDLMEHGKNRGITAFTLEVRASNIKAKSLYERMGFRCVGVRKGFYPDKEDACIYWLYFNKREEY